MYIWEFPKGIHESRLKALAARCIKVIKLIGKQDIPYAFEYKGKRNFDKEGVYSTYNSGDEFGVTCSTFILTLFESVGIEVLDWRNWEVRVSEDLDYFRRFIRLVRIYKEKGLIEMSDEHFQNLESEENCKKIRPEEIFAAAYCSNLPMNFLCSSEIGKKIRTYTLKL